MILVDLLLAAALAAASPVADLIGPVSPVRSISIEDADFTDLAPLGADIGDARIVMLGEQSHGDGASFAAKARLVRYLHDVKGFDVLAFESGMFELDTAERAVAAGAAPSAVLPDALFPVWSAADQFRPLLAWLDANRKGPGGGRPMALAGFDIQLTGALARELPATLVDAGARTGIAAPFRRLADAVTALRERRGAAALPDAPAVAADVGQALAALQASRLPDRAWLAQLVRSVRTDLRFIKGMATPGPAVANLRDMQMAENLAWLADGPYRGRKIVVWGATSHLLRQRSDFTGDATAAMVPMGSYLARARGAEIYVLAVTSGGGSVGSWVKRDATDVGLPDEGSLEAALIAPGRAYAFAPLSPGYAGTSWMLGYQPMAGPWGRSVDGLFYIARQAPTTYPAR